MPLSDVLGRIPGLGGYLQQKQMNEQRGVGELQQASGLMQILQQVEAQKQRQQAAARQEEYRRAMGALPPDATEDQMLQVARPFQGPDQIGQQITASRDRKAKLEQHLREVQMQLTAKKEAAEQALAAKIELAKQAGADKREVMQMQLEGRKEIAGMMAAVQRESIAARREALSLSQNKPPIEVKDERGNVRLFDRQGNLIKNLGAVGSPSVQVQKIEAERKKASTTIDEAIRELEGATKDGGLIDKSTGSGAGALVDTAAGFVGMATPGAVAVGQMQPIFDLVLKMVPRFEGPQSDKDTQTYREAAGQLANPNVPNKIKKQAGKTVLELMKRRKEQFVSKDTPAEALPPSGGVKFLGFE